MAPASGFAESFRVLHTPRWHAFAVRAGRRILPLPGGPESSSSSVTGPCSERERRFSDDERDTVHRNVDRVRATCEWILTAVDTGQVDVDEELAKLLRGE
ncbi:DUF6192 family protein [Streptomyces sp. NPDC058371]|uniref:DUF6192 family protein n=1 Tax=Streptomyces sp. NPDC058371 TaxID=3346463 RepID=UPI003648A33F